MYHIHLAAEHGHGSAVVFEPAGIAQRRQIIALPHALGLPQHAGKGAGRIIHMQELMHGQPVPTDDDGLTLADAIQPGKIPRDLAQYTQLRPVGGRWLDDHRREAFLVVGA